MVEMSVGVNECEREMDAMRVAGQEQRLDLLSHRRVKAFSVDTSDVV
jgi:hypothetical protein